MATDQALVSIIIPTYNRQDLLRLAVESCFEQTYEAVRVIVVDDGSTDGTADYLRSLGPSRRDKIIWEVQPNLGPSAARNRGLELADGEFIKFLDSDDTLEKDAIECFVRAMNAHKADLCIGSKRYMSPKGRKWSIVYAPPEGMIDDPLNKFFDLVIRPQQGLWCFRRSVFDEGVRWNESLRAREDTDLLARVLLRGHRVCGAPLATFNQRYHTGPRVSAGQFSPDVSQAIFQSNVEIYEEMGRRGELGRYGRRFARALSRTSLRL